METRKLNELFQILYDDIKDKSEIHSLCGCIDDLFCGCGVSYDEKNKLSTFFHSQKPTKILHPEFYHHKVYKGETWWWKFEFIEESTKQRKLFTIKTSWKLF